MPKEQTKQPGFQASPIRVKVTTMTVSGEGINLTLQGCLEEEPKTDAPFHGSPSSTGMQLALKPEAAKNFTVGKVYELAFKEV